MSADLNELRKRVGEPHETTRVVLQKGDTFWRLAEIKYGGMHPIDAIYAVNDLLPRYEDRDGRKVLVDPIYYAGREYILPAKHELAKLQTEFWQSFDPATDEERLGVSDKRSSVCLRWDENFTELTRKKYNGRDAANAVYELNHMTPSVTVQDGVKQVSEPICQAGRSYDFPAEIEISELETKYKERIKRLLVD
ncbi:MAG: LysM peptidoglycan-binding domain-containing protein [Cyanobacteria bacterium SZAS LIN-5]|nr:LysM peptidoglycan-binding domain-containing protein [Cyanobacteria bacterium SZAS LIN-5]RTL35333.1 MAG: LysM domain-containing protein [Candidatus Melainabacteria bacterium]